MKPVLLTSRYIPPLLIFYKAFLVLLSELDTNQSSYSLLGNHGGKCDL